MATKKVDQSLLDAVDAKYGKGSAKYLIDSINSGNTKEAMEKIKGGVRREKTYDDNTNTSYKGSDINTASSKQYDYDADIKTNKGRGAEIDQNLYDYATNKPEEYYGGIDSYRTRFDYDERSQSQKDQLDDAYGNYHKYGLSPTENAVADSDAQIADEKNQAKIETSYNNMIEKRNNLDTYVSQVLPDMKSIMDKYETTLNDYLDEIAELKALNKQYYKAVKDEYMESAAGDMSGIASQLSAQGLSAGAISGAQKQAQLSWNKQYNDLMKKHIETLSKLNDDGATMTRNILSDKRGALKEKKELLKSYTDSINGMLDDIEGLTQTKIDEHYNTYETISSSKVESAAEGAAKQTTIQELQSNYAALNNVGRQKLLMNYLITLYGDEVKPADYMKYLETAAEQPDAISAMRYITEQAGIKSTQKSSPFSEDPDQPFEDSNTPNPNYDSYFPNYDSYFPEKNK